MASAGAEALTGRKRKHAEADHEPHSVAAEAPPSPDAASAAVAAAEADQHPQQQQLADGDQSQSAAVASGELPSSNGQPTTTAELPPAAQDQEQKSSAAGAAAAGRSKKPKTTSQPPQLPPGKRWARRQVEHVERQAAEEQGDYNIWWGRSQTRWRERGIDKSHASTQCEPELDSGLTRGDFETAGAPLCLHFAKGSCVNGAQCTFLHRLPTEEDLARLDPYVDVFGRDRKATDREDMDGVGNFNRDLRTLFVANVAHLNASDCAARVAKHFGRWGRLELISVKPNHRCVFVTYTHRGYAEFAKIAMSDQSLDHDESLRVRWAYDDPNPAAQARKAQDTVDVAVQHVQDYLYARGELGVNTGSAAAAAAGAVVDTGVYGYGREVFHAAGDEQQQPPAASASKVAPPAAAPASSAAPVAAAAAAEQGSAQASEAALRAHHLHFQTHYQPQGWSWQQYWIMANQQQPAGGQQQPQQPQQQQQAPSQSQQLQQLLSGGASAAAAGAHQPPPGSGGGDGGSLGPLTADQQQALGLQETASHFNALLDMIDARKQQQ